ncbi:4757_t:CDS:1, partial [Funneliformis mosseae]
LCTCIKGDRILVLIDVIRFCGCITVSTDDVRLCAGDVCIISTE